MFLITSVASHFSRFRFFFFSFFSSFCRAIGMIVGQSPLNVLGTLTVLDPSSAKLIQQTPLKITGRAASLLLSTSVSLFLQLGATIAFTDGASLKMLPGSSLIADSSATAKITIDAASVARFGLESPSSALVTVSVPIVSEGEVVVHGGGETLIKRDLVAKRISAEGSPTIRILGLAADTPIRFTGSVLLNQPGLNLILDSCSMTISAGVEAFVNRVEARAAIIKVSEPDLSLSRSRSHSLCSPLSRFFCFVL
jgi:hypothetical protein